MICGQGNVTAELILGLLYFRGEGVTKDLTTAKEWFAKAGHHGNAEALTFADNSFDVVVNVEASLYYPNITKFYEHVRRVLKPDGYFLYTDLRYEEKVAIWHAQLKNMGLKLIKEEDITD